MTAPPRPVAVARRLLSRPIDPAARDVVELAAWVVREGNDARAGEVGDLPAADRLHGHLQLFTDGDGVTRWAFQDGRYTWTDRWGRLRTSPFGMRLLRTGDHLAVYAKDVHGWDTLATPAALWRGVVTLPPPAAEAGKGEFDAAMEVDRVTWHGWFLRCLPAELRPA